MHRYLCVDNTICHKEYLIMVNVLFCSIWYVINRFSRYIMLFLPFFLFVSSKCKEILINTRCPKWKKKSWTLHQVQICPSPSWHQFSSFVTGYLSTGFGSRTARVRLLGSVLYIVIVSSLYVPLLVSPFWNKPHFQSLSSFVSDNSFPAPCCHVGFVYSLNSK